MEKQEALNLISQVCSVHRGTIQEHQAIQQALKVISECITETKAKPSKK